MNIHKAFFFFSLTDAVSLAAWLEAYTAFEADKSEKVPDEWRVIAYGAWLLANKPADVGGGAKIVSFFRRHRIEAVDAKNVIEAAFAEPEHLRLACAELLEHEAMTPFDMRTPAGLRATLHADDFLEALAVWRTEGKSQRIQKVTERLRKKAAAVPPPPPTPKGGRCLSPAPSSLLEALEKSLPSNVRHVANIVGQALAVMKLQNRKIWNAEKLVDQVLGASNPTRNDSIWPVTQALQWLSRRGVVANKSGDYEICMPTGEDTLGQQILNLVR